MRDFRADFYNVHRPFWTLRFILWQTIPNIACDSNLWHHSLISFLDFIHLVPAFGYIIYGCIFYILFDHKFSTFVIVIDLYCLEMQVYCFPSPLIGDSWNLDKVSGLDLDNCLGSRNAKQSTWFSCASVSRLLMGDSFHLLCF